MQQTAASTKLMAPNSDTRENFLLWFTKEFGFSCNAATALYNVQMLKDAQTLSELHNDAVANICKAVSKDVGQSVAEVAATKLKLACVWIRHQHRTLREIGGTQRPLVRIEYSGEIDLLREQKREENQWAAAHTEPEYPLLTLTPPPPRRHLTRLRPF
jgi:hypothetical protein